MFPSPLVHLEELHNSFVAVVAVQIQPILKMPNGFLASLNAREQRDEYIRQINSFIQSIFHNFDLTSITLRYIYMPVDNKKTPFVISCLLRADGGTTQEATDRIRHVWEDFVACFPHTLYTLVPILDEQLFSRIYNPISHKKVEIVEIRKLEDITPTKYVAAGDFFYSVKPISAQYVSIEDALQFISQQHAPFVISICLWPTYLTDEEYHLINQVAGELHKFATGFSMRMYSGTTVFEPDLNARTCFERYTSLLKNSDSLAQFRIQVVSSQPIAPFVVKSIAKTFCLDYQLEFLTDENRDKAIWTYRFLDPRPIWGGSEIWDDEDAPSSLRRLSYLANFDEMLRLFRLPILFHERKPGTVVFAERIEHMGDKNFTIQGDVNAPMQVTFDKVFGDITQSLEASPILSQPNLKQLLILLEELKSQLKFAPSEKAEDVKNVTNRVQKISEELKSAKPNKDDLEYHGRQLVKASENLSQILPNVLDIAGRIVKFILTLSL